MSFQRLIYQSILWRGIYFISVTVLNILIARYYEASDSGLIYFITNSLALIVLLSSFSLESGIAYYVASGKMKPARLANFAILWSVLSTVVVYLAMKILVHIKLIPVFYGQYGIVASCYIGGCILINFFTAIFYALKNYFLPNIIMTLVNLALIILVPFSGTLIAARTYINIYFGGFLVQGFFVCICFIIANRGGWKIAMPSSQSLKLIFGYALQALGANLLFFLLYRIDYWLVERYCSAAALGNYIQVSKFVQLFLVVPMMMASVVFPVAAGPDTEASKKIILVLSRLIVSFYALICAIPVVFGYWLFPLVYGDSFREMYIPFLALVPGIFFLGLLNLMGAYFGGQNKIRLNIISSLLGLIIIVAGDILFIPAKGIIAAAVISSAGYFVNLAFLIRIFISQNNSHLRDLLLLQKKDIRWIRNWIIEKMK